MKNLLLSLACLVVLSALPACKKMSCDKAASSQPASQPAAKS